MDLIPAVQKRSYRRREVHEKDPQEPADAGAVDAAWNALSSWKSSL
jgi:hypothetical protein